jgi:hypothetical protein
MDSFLYALKHTNLTFVVLVSALLGLRSNVMWWVALTLLIVLVAVETAHGAVMGWFYRLATKGRENHAADPATGVAADV